MFLLQAIDEWMTCLRPMVIKEFWWSVAWMGVMQIIFLGFRLLVHPFCPLNYRFINWFCTLLLFRVNILQGQASAWLAVRGWNGSGAGHLPPIVPALVSFGILSYHIIQIYSRITRGKAPLYTKILEVSLFAFAYRMFHENFSPIYGEIFMKQSVVKCK